MITIREAAAGDARPLFDWRNDAQTRAASASTGVIDWDDHLEWFTRSLASDRRHIFIAERQPEGEAVGMVRFDLDDDGTAEVSININPDFRGEGLGRTVLREGIDRFRELESGRSLRALIRPANAASVRLFETAGFARVDEADGFLRYALS